MGLTDLDYEIEVLEDNIYDMEMEREAADLDGDWDLFDHLSTAIEDVEQDLKHLYEKRDLLA